MGANASGAERGPGGKAIGVTATSSEPRHVGASREEVAQAVEANPELKPLAEKLLKLIEEHPYLEPGRAVKASQQHPLSCWVALCRDSLVDGRLEQANEHFERVQVGLRAELRPIAEAFRRFDVDASGQLDTSEFRHMCAYLGWGDEEADLMDLDGDGKVSLTEFQAFVGAFGGIQQLFEKRRQRVATSRKDVCDSAGITIGSRVKAHYYIKGHRSKSWREAVVLAIGVERPGAAPGSSSTGVRLEFGFEASDEGTDWRAQQLVPPSWIVSREQDAALATALREVGILEDHQSFWSLVMPPTELEALQHLEGCQRAALALIRSQATDAHEQALPSLQSKLEKLGMGSMELQAALDWVQDLAPVCVHVSLDTMGRFLEVDDYYRSQFETKTSEGAGHGDQGNSTRRSWEHELFGGHYDNAKDFERCKYGALCVMNDYRGVVTAEQYGDSYLVLKDVRLRITLASEDSGGMEGQRLAVLDKYAHVLNEYNDEELKQIVGIATSAVSRDRESLSAAANAVQVLRGSSADPTAQWITMGFPKLARKSGRYYFEVLLLDGAGAPQVGLLSTAFEPKPKVFSQEGVGDDKHGWAVDVLNAALWHDGQSLPWPKACSAKEVTAQERGQYPWQTINVQERVLSEDTRIGIVVDVDKGAIWFSADNRWTHEPSLKFPAGTAVYPAMSVKGRAAFTFGKRTFEPPDHVGACATWPEVPMEVVRIDCPHLGNEEKLDCYKEVQIHGEVHLKKHVQRLVAHPKYRDKPKNERSLALRVVDAGDCNGTYTRVGAHGGAPLYHNESAGCLYFDAASSTWRLNDTQMTSAYRFFAKAAADSQLPPRRGWQVKDEEAGVIDAAAFKQAMLDSGIEAAKAGTLMEALSAGNLVYRKRGAQNIVSEWEKLGSPPPASAEEVWQKALDAVQEKLKRDAGVSHAKLVETDHPYQAARHNWSKEEQFDGAVSLKVYFASKSCTYDQKSNLHIHGGGLSRAAAGPGARVEVATANNGKVWGTLESKTDGVWKVLLDRRPERPEDEDEEEGGLDELGIPRWPQPGDAVEARYKSGTWYEGVVSDTDIEVDWYEAKRRVIYTIDWADGDTQDRQKGPDDVRRRPDQKPLEGHHYLEEVPVYGSIAPKKTQCTVNILEAPTTVTVMYGGGVCEEFEIVDTDGEKTKAVFDAGKVTFSHDEYGEYEVTNFGIYPKTDDDDEVVEGEYGIEVPFGGLDLVGSTEEQLDLLARFLATAERFEVQVDVEEEELLDMLRKRKEAARASAATASGVAIGAEIRRFALDASCPVSPITVEGLAAGDGPAQQKGVKAGWHLDLEASMRSDSALREAVEQQFHVGEGEADEATLLERAFSKPQDLLKLLNESLLQRNDATLVFRDSASQAQAQLLPEAYAQYKGTRVSSEIKLFQSESRQVKIEAFLKNKKRGPAQDAGVRTNWVLDVHKTLHHNPSMTGKLTEEAIVENPNVLLGLSDVLLVFKLPNPSKVKLKTCNGPAGAGSWGTCEIPGDSVLFSFSSDGDGGRDDIAKRWGVCAVVMDGGAKAPAQDKLDDFATKWAEAKRRAEWVKDPEVQRDDWDEARLRALCAKHGWEFEWKTEDGERRRRTKEIAALRSSGGVTEASMAMKGLSSRSGDHKASALPDGALHAVDEHPQGVLSALPGAAAVAGETVRRWMQAPPLFGGGLAALNLAKPKAAEGSDAKKDA